MNSKTGHGIIEGMFCCLPLSFVKKVSTIYFYQSDMIFQVCKKTLWISYTLECQASFCLSHLRTAFPFILCFPVFCAPSWHLTLKVIRVKFNAFMWSFIHLEYFFNTTMNTQQIKTNVHWSNKSIFVHWWQPFTCTC